LENLFASSLCCSPRRCTNTDFAERNAAKLEDVLVMLNEIRGGLNDNEVKDVAVKPTGPDADDKVMMATPAGCRRKAVR